MTDFADLRACEDCEHARGRYNPSSPDDRGLDGPDGQGGLGDNR